MPFEHSSLLFYLLTFNGLILIRSELRHQLSEEPSLAPLPASVRKQPFCSPRSLLHASIYNFQRLFLSTSFRITFTILIPFLCTS